MPRYFFDTSDTTDATGVDLPDQATAHAYALGFVETIMRGENVKPGQANTSVTIRGENGEAIETVQPDHERG